MIDAVIGSLAQPGGRLHRVSGRSEGAFFLVSPSSPSVCLCGLWLARCTVRVQWACGEGDGTPVERPGDGSSER